MDRIGMFRGSYRMKAKKEAAECDRLATDTSDPHQRELLSRAAYLYKRAAETDDEFVARELTRGVADKLKDRYKRAVQAKEAAAECDQLATDTSDPHQRELLSRAAYLYKRAAKTDDVRTARELTREADEYKDRYKRAAQAAACDLSAILTELTRDEDEYKDRHKLAAQGITVLKCIYDEDEYKDRHKLAAQGLNLEIYMPMNFGWCASAHITDAKMNACECYQNATECYQLAASTSDPDQLELLFCAADCYNAAAETDDVNTARKLTCKADKFKDRYNRASKAKAKENAEYDQLAARISEPQQRELLSLAADLYKRAPRTDDENTVYHLAHYFQRVAQEIHISESRKISFDDLKDITCMLCPGLTPWMSPAQSEVHDDNRRIRLKGSDFGGNPNDNELASYDTYHNALYSKDRKSVNVGYGDSRDCMNFAETKIHDKWKMKMGLEDDDIDGNSEDNMFPVRPDCLASPLPRSLADRSIRMRYEDDNIGGNLRNNKSDAHDDILGSINRQSVNIGYDGDKLDSTDLKSGYSKMGKCIPHGSYPIGSSHKGQGLGVNNSGQSNFASSSFGTGGPDRSDEDSSRAFRQGSDGEDSNPPNPPNTQFPRDASSPDDDRQRRIDFSKENAAECSDITCGPDQHHFWSHAADKRVTRTDGFAASDLTRVEDTYKGRYKREAQDYHDCINPAKAKIPKVCNIKIRLEDDDIGGNSDDNMFPLHRDHLAFPLLQSSADNNIRMRYEDDNLGGNLQNNKSDAHDDIFGSRDRRSVTFGCDGDTLHSTDLKSGYSKMGKCIPHGSDPNGSSHKGHESGGNNSGQSNSASISFGTGGPGRSDEGSSRSSRQPSDGEDGNPPNPQFPRDASSPRDDRQHRIDFWRDVISHAINELVALGSGPITHPSDPSGDGPQRYDDHYMTGGPDQSDESDVDHHRLIDLLRSTAVDRAAINELVAMEAERYDDQLDGADGTIPRNRHRGI